MICLKQGMTGTVGLVAFLNGLCEMGRKFAQLVEASIELGPYPW
jgi:hypothetical protein